jgi:hypothetical protein
MLRKRLWKTFVFLTVSVETSPAWAVQAHGGAEGLLSHQIGHLLFATGMGYLLFRLRTMRQSGRGWLEFKTSFWLLIAWNLVTFTGHWMNEFIAKEQFIKDQTTILSFTIANLPDAIYYLTRLDHLILVPSFAFLLLALRKRGMPQ